MQIWVLKKNYGGKSRYLNVDNNKQSKFEIG